MIEKQRGKERTFKHEIGKIVVGTIDKKNCSSVYLSLETRITPEYSLVESVDKIRRKLKANMRFIGSTYLEQLDTYLIAIDYNQTKTQDKPGKVSFIRIELTLFGDFEWDDDFIFTLNQMGDTILTLVSTCDELTIAS